MLEAEWGFKTWVNMKYFFIRESEVLGITQKMVTLVEWSLKTCLNMVRYSHLTLVKWVRFKDKGAYEVISMIRESEVLRHHSKNGNVSWVRFKDMFEFG